MWGSGFTSRLSLRFTLPVSRRIDTALGLVGLLALGCSAEWDSAAAWDSAAEWDSAAAWDSAADEYATDASVRGVEQDIVNGTDWTSGWPDWRSVRIYNSTSRGFCSATAIRDQWVITAKHCVTDNGESTGNVVSADKITVGRINHSAPSGNTPTGLGIYVHPAAEDVALVRFLQYLPLDGTSVSTFLPEAAFTPIYGGPRADFTSMLCSGYGFESYATQNDCWFERGTINSNDFEYFYTSATRKTSFLKANVEEPWLEIKPTNLSYQIQTDGDSGSSCAISDGATTVSNYPIVYVHSRGGSCIAIPASAGGGWTRDSASGADMVSFRSWVNDTLGRWEDYSPFSYDGICSESYKQTFNPPGGTANWQCTGTNRYDNSNVGQAIITNQLNWGPSVIMTKYPHNNGSVRVKVLSSDNDTAGVIGRWTDQNNFYFLAVDPQNDRVQIVKNKNGTMSILAWATLTQLGASWGNVWHEIRLSFFGPHLIGSVDDQIAVEVSDTSSPHTTGFAGLMHAHMNPVTFDDFVAAKTFQAENTDRTPIY
jgi:hypothetical protein